MTDEDAYAADPVSDSEDALRELRDALSSVGLVLPSLGLDLVGDGGEPYDALIALGCCSRDTARCLAAVLRAAR